VLMTSAAVAAASQAGSVKAAVALRPLRLPQVTVTAPLTRSSRHSRVAAPAAPAARPMLKLPAAMLTPSSAGRVLPLSSVSMCVPARAMLQSTAAGSQAFAPAGMAAVAAADEAGVHRQASTAERRSAAKSRLLEADVTDCSSWCGWGTANSRVRDQGLRARKGK